MPGTDVEDRHDRWAWHLYGSGLLTFDSDWDAAEGVWWRSSSPNGATQPGMGREGRGSIDLQRAGAAEPQWLTADHLLLLRDLLTEARSSRSVRPRLVSGEEGAIAISVTGTDNCSEDQVERAFWNTAASYLDMGNVWYLGSGGTVDETVARILVERGENVAIVAFDSHDVSEDMAEIIEEDRLQLISAIDERRPSEGDSVNPRDSYLLEVSDLVIVIWDGRSEGTRAFIERLPSSGVRYTVTRV
jgi:hypothetical protein